jgi:LemA protein
MKRTWIVLAVIVVFLAIVGGSCVSRYNSLVTSHEDISEKWSQVQNVIKRRADLIPNLVNVVKGYAEHEKEIFLEVANARSRLLGAQTPAATAQAEVGLNAALGRLLAISERYPDLKANQNFTQLQDELAGTENRIAVERKRYNEAVGTFNKKIRTFPNSMLAGFANLEKHEYFEADAGDQAVPDVKF